MNLLEFSNFSLSYGVEEILHQISFVQKEGESIAVIGKNGSGKSTLINSILQLTPSKQSGDIYFSGSIIDQDLLKTIRGREIGIIFQNPLEYLNPIMTIQKQILEAIHTPEKEGRLNELLSLVHLPMSVKGMLPSQLSGGMRQRVLVAIAIASNPKILIADEPTTFLDTVLKAEIISLIKDLQKKLKFSLLLVSHDLSVVEQLVSKVLVLDRGRVVEEMELSNLFNSPQSEVAKELVDAYLKVKI